MTVERADAVRKAEVLVEALPFIRKFHGDTIVVKLGGSSMEEAKANVLEDIVLLRYVGMNPVVVHGGGREITAWQQKMGIESRFVDGLRGIAEGVARLADRHPETGFVLPVHPRSGIRP